MSTSSEYYIRNMSTAEFERFYRRLESERRSQTLGSIRADLERSFRDAIRAEGHAAQRELTELKGNIATVEAQLRAQVDCNRRMAESLESRLGEFRRQGELAHERAMRAISLLRDENAKIEGQILEHRARLSEAERRIKSVEATLAAERVRRQEEARRLVNHADALKASATAALNGIPAETLAELGLSATRLRVEGMLRQGDSHERAAASQAAAAVFGDARLQALALLDEASEREGNLRASRATIDLHLAATRARVKELATEDVDRFLGEQVREVIAEEKRIRDAILDGRVEWTTRIAGLRQLAEAASALSARAAKLHAEYEELVEKASVRESVLRALVEALVEVWGTTFEMDVEYARPGDARSPIVFRSKRGPFAPNIQAVLDIDGRLEAHFTGYQGVDCVKDLGEVKQRLRQRAIVDLVEKSHSVKPDQPNPPDVGPANLGGIVDLVRPGNTMIDEKRGRRR